MAQHYTCDICGGDCPLSHVGVAKAATTDGLFGEGACHCILDICPGCLEPGEERSGDVEEAIGLALVARAQRRMRKEKADG